jgi:prepilin-type N-terminal cleavage/methylation domain-containing protein
VDCVRRERGFTLIELMIVVVIIAVLVAVAIVSYTRYLRNSRLVDARGFISAIQARQESYFQRFGYYVNVNYNNSYAFYPTLVTGGEPVAKDWCPSGTCPAYNWDVLGARPEKGSTYFQFMVRASIPTWDATNKVMAHTLAGSASSLGIPAQPLANTGRPQHPWYYAIGQGNLDGTGSCPGDPPAIGDCTQIYITSARSEIVTLNEGK